jgi:hypothetical protein
MSINKKTICITLAIAAIIALLFFANFDTHTQVVENTNTGSEKPALVECTEATNVTIKVSTWVRWRDNWKITWDAAYTNGVVAHPNRLNPDSAEAIEYVRIARTKVKQGDDILEPTVDIYDEGVIVAFPYKIEDVDGRPPPPGTPFYYIVEIDIKTKTVVNEFEW